MPNFDLHPPHTPESIWMTIQINNYVRGRADFGGN